MAEFPNLGRNCDYESCGSLDFLPFLCSGCAKSFCLSHRQPDSHHCNDRVTAGAVDISLQNGLPSSRCSLDECRNRELVDIVCEHCQQSFCVLHRHQEGHACVKLLKTENVESKTAKLVKSILESKVSSSSTSEQRKRRQGNAKTLAKVNLMKMKMCAIGEAELPHTERIYLTVNVFNEENVLLATKAFFFSKLCSVGRVIDTISSVEKLKNVNNKAFSQKLRLYHSDNEPLAMDSTMDDLVSNGFVLNGDTVSLKFDEVL